MLPTAVEVLRIRYLRGLLPPSFLCVFLQDTDHEHFLSQTALNKKENELNHMVSVTL